MVARTENISAPDSATQSGTAFPRTLIRQRLRAVIITVCTLLLLVIAGFLWNQWNTYSDARKATSAFDIFRATLMTMGKVSAERGPTNSVLGEDLPIPETQLDALRAARSASDISIAKLSTLLATANCTGCAIGSKAIEQLQSDLFAARGYVDQLAGIPLSQRTRPSLDEAVNRMVNVIPQFTQVIEASELDIAGDDAHALSFLQMARFAAMLREYAGLLGSRFTGALVERRPLTETEQLNIENALGHVDQLRWAIGSLAANNSTLTVEPLERVREQYFERGLDYIQSVRRFQNGSAAALPSTAQFANQYVPLMHPIIDFRDEMLNRAGAELQRHLDRVLTRLIGTTAIGMVLIGAQFLVIWMYRRYVILPFHDATRAIIAIAADKLPAQIQSRTYHGEIQSLFNAVQILKAHSSRRLQLEDELRAMAETDALTGLLNRRSFESRGRVLCAVSPTEHSSLALIMFDIDHFKQINDTYGHPTGDLALKTIGDLCRKTWRKDDIVARIGGEEFAVLLETPNPVDAIHTVQRFRENIAAANLCSTQGECFNFTASFGIAFSTRMEPQEVTTLLAQADELLYKAKEGGRNRVEADVTRFS